MSLSVSQIITVAKISQYLADDDVAKGSLFGKRIAATTGKILYMERKAVEWLYDLDPTDTSLTLTANYLLSLCRGYNLKAASISGSGGSVSPIVPVPTPSDDTPAPYQFLVDESSFIINGESSKTITLFIGFQVLFSRNGVPQSTVTSESSYYTWNRTTGEFFVSPSANTGELFQIFAI